MAKWWGDPWEAERWCNHDRGDEGVRNRDRGDGWAMERRGILEKLDWLDRERQLMKALIARMEQQIAAQAARLADMEQQHQQQQEATGKMMNRATAELVALTMDTDNTSGRQVREAVIACGASSSVTVAPVHETFERRYATLIELVDDEDIYLINFYGRVYKLDGTHRDFLDDRLREVRKNAIGMLFGGCLVLLPADVAVKNLGYLRPVSVPRTNWLVTGTGTNVYDLRKDMQGLYQGEWRRVNLDKVAREFWAVVVEHDRPSAQNLPLYEYLMLETGVDSCPCAEYAWTGWVCRNSCCPRSPDSRQVTQRAGG